MATLKTGATVNALQARSEKFRSAQRLLLEAIAEEAASLRAVRPSSPEMKAQFETTLKEFAKNRGRDLYFPFLASGIGSGPFVQLLDGSVKYDMITGIGINFFGHSHPELMSEMIEALPADTMQGNLQPGVEAADFLRTILSMTAPSRLAKGWMMCSGTMSNEVALKIVRQKKFPATKILAFTDCFAGRSTAMQEITDNPKYREQQPTYGEVEYLPFYDPAAAARMGGALAHAEMVVNHLKYYTDRYPGRFAALMIEPIQGEGGFNFAPREWYVKIFEAAKQAGIAIWADEIQSFGRTGEMFAFQTLGIAEYVDVVTIGKMLQACMVLFTEEYNPKPGLVSGTFSGSTVALRAGRRTLELLRDGGYLGAKGKIAQLSKRFETQLSEIPGIGAPVRAIGGMIAFQPGKGSAEEVKALLLKLFDLGVIAFNCGHGPYLVRMLPPLGAMTEADVDAVCAIVKKAMA